MPYLLTSVNENVTCKCDDPYWVRVIDLAREEGWQPDGTMYNFDSRVDELTDEMYDPLYNLFFVVMCFNEIWQWEGSYTEKENQIVTDEDAYYLRLALQGTGTDEELMRFLEKGSFRIGPG